MSVQWSHLSKDGNGEKLPKSADVMIYIYIYIYIYIPHVAGDVRKQNNTCRTEVYKLFQLLTKRFKMVQTKLVKAVK
jgi:hypothetical protein